MRFSSRSAVLLAASVLVASCATGLRPINRGTRPITAGRFVTDDVRIVAVDSSFQLTGGEEFRAPFQTTVAFASGGSNTSIASGGWRVALDHGARRVYIYRGGRRFYGVLALAPAPQRARGPATASYRIDIPSAYFQAANAGRLAFVGERVACGGAQCAVAYTWLIWLSDTDFTL